MSEWSPFMYASVSPIPTFYHPRLKREKERRPQTQQRSNSVTARSRPAFRHSRTSSGSRASQSSHDSSSLHSNSSPAPVPPVSTSVGDNSQHQQSVGASSSDSRGPTSTAAASRPLPSSRPGANTAGSSSIFSSRTGSGVTSWRSRERRVRQQEAPFVDVKNVTMYSEFEAGHKSTSGITKQISIPFSRTESVSSTSATTTVSNRTMTSTNPSNSSDNTATKPFVLRNGRTYFNDATLPYPLPMDLTELHRQCLRTMMLIQVFGAPFTTPSLFVKPPEKVLEVGCGSGFWSMMCHRYYKERGHTGISFTGVDIAPLAPGSTNTPADAIKPDREMKWKFIQHDLRQMPWPMATEEYDLVMVKDVSITTPNMLIDEYIEEYIRLIKPGGIIEIWESDCIIRMLRPHVPSPAPGSQEAEEHETASKLGAYVMTSNTPLSAPLNTFLVEYNNWLTRALESRSLIALPCTLIGPYLLQESDTLKEVRSKRLAIPLSEVRWEREGVGGVVTKDGKSYVEMKGKGAPHQKVEKKTLTSGQSALRKTALLTVVQQIQALEPILRDASGKSQDEWDVWLGKMMADLMSESGTTWGECLEVGAWSARKRLA